MRIKLDQTGTRPRVMNRSLNRRNPPDKATLLPFPPAQGSPARAPLHLGVQTAVRRPHPSAGSPGSDPQARARLPDCTGRGRGRAAQKRPCGRFVLSFRADVLLPTSAQPCERGRQAGPSPGFWKHLNCESTPSPTQGRSVSRGRFQGRRNRCPPLSVTEAAARGGVLMAFPGQPVSPGRIGSCGF